MNRRYKRRTNSSKLKEILTSHIENNLKEYIIVGLMFFIGIIIGIIFINRASDGQKEEITTYISSFATDLKENKSVNEMALLLDSLKKNFLLAIFLWFMGSTVIGISIVYLTICFRGFCLGYTVSSAILTFGTRKRNFIFNFNNFFTKYFIHTMYINACC